MRPSTMRLLSVPSCYPPVDLFRPASIVEINRRPLFWLICLLLKSEHCDRSRYSKSSGEEFLNRFEVDVLCARSRFDVMERPSRRRAIDSLHPVNAHRRIDRAGDVFHIDRAGARPAGVNDLPAGLIGLAND